MNTQTLDSSRLEALLESAQLLGSSLDLDSLLSHLLRTVLGRLLVGRGFVAVETRGEMRFAHLRGLKTLRVGDVFDRQAAENAGVEFFFPIGSPENPIGLLGIGKPANADVLIHEDQALKALLGLAASSIANAQAHYKTQIVNHELDQKIQELRALLDLTRGLTAALEPEEVARLLVLTLTGRWAVGKYWLAVQKSAHPTILRSKGIALPEIPDFENAVGDLPEAALVADLPDGVLKNALTAQNAQIVFRLRSSDTTWGVLAFGARMGKNDYTAADLEFGAGLVAQAGVAFENSWHVLATIERKKIEQELELAARIQEGLFPESLPVLKGYDAAVRNRAARWCGGDYYDILPVENVAGQPASFLLCVADVSGKGLPASLLMSNMQATLRALLGRVPSLVELAARTNELLHATTPANKFVTAILLELEPATGRAKYVNAGHGDCLLLRGANGAVERLESTGLPLGMMPPEMLEMLGKNYTEKTLQLNHGDLLALYFDGVTEAHDIHENEWGDERLVECLRKVEKNSAQQIVERIFEQIDQFAATAPQHDDITVLIIKRSSESAA